MALTREDCILVIKGNQNIFNKFNVLSADFLPAQSTKSNSESRILNESGREGLGHRIGRMQDEA